MSLGCGGFLGCLWVVTDRAALSFAREFYRLLAEGLGVADAVTAARLRVRALHPGDPTWLAYCCFASPVARVERSTAHP